MNKKSIKLSAKDFSKSVDETLEFTRSVKELNDKKMLSDKHKSWCFDHAIIRLYREFENFMFHCFVALINNESKALRRRTGVEFPKHIKVEVCEYLIRGGDDYFSFKNSSTMIKKIRKLLVPPKDSHWFIEILRKNKDPLELLTGLRNFAAHNSPYAKNVALQSIKITDSGRKYMSSSSGVWLKGNAEESQIGSTQGSDSPKPGRQRKSSPASSEAQEPDQRQTDRNRFAKICESLKKMAKEIENQAR